MIRLGKSIEAMEIMLKAKERMLLILEKSGHSQIQTDILKVEIDQFAQIIQESKQGA